jgi:general stress protein 26
MSQETNLTDAWRAAGSIRVAMATSWSAKGMRSRPLTAHVDGEFQQIHFIVPSHAEICQQLQANDELHLSFVDIKGQNYISITTTAFVTEDAVLAKRLWNPFAQAWFPNGPDDPDVRIIEAKPKMLEYWAGESSKLMTAWEIGKSLRTKKAPDLGETLKVAY